MTSEEETGAERHDNVCPDSPFCVSSGCSEGFGPAPAGPSVSPVEFKRKTNEERRGVPPTADRGFRRVPAYTTFSVIYDIAMGAAVLPSLIDAFSESRRRFGVGTDSIADIGCGTGRFLKYLGRFGGTLIGVDRSPAMLRRATRRLQGADVQLLRMDLRDLALPGPVQTLTCTFDTLNYLLDPRDLGRTFRNFAAALQPGGTLIFDFIPRGACPATASGRQRVRIGRILSEWRVQIDPGGGGSTVAILMRDTARPEARPTFEIHRQRWHARTEIRTLLKDSGFEIVDWRPAEPGGGDGWLHVVARRTDAAPEGRTP